MAVGINTIWEIRQTASASNVNGCGFNPENANMMTDLATTGSSGQSATPTVSSATYTFVAGDQNAYLFIQAGTSWTPGWYQITAVSGGVATLDAAVGHAVKYVNPGGSRNLLLSTVAGVGTTGALTGGTFTIDYSQQDVAGFSGTDLAGLLATSAAPTVTSVSKPFSRNKVGNFIHITAGTSWTTGIYEIVSVSSTTATLDRACGSIASPTGGTFNIGGAASLCTSSGFTDDIFFEMGLGTTGSGAHVYMVRSGTYATLSAVSLTAAGTFQNPIRVRGYGSYRMDYPTGSSRPVWGTGANAFTLGAHWRLRDIIFTGTSTTGITVGVSGTLMGVKSINTSTTADRQALSAGSAGSIMIGCEGISYRGRGIATTVASNFFGCYAHDSDTCFYFGGGSITGYVMSHCIAEGGVNNAVKLNAALSSGQLCIQNCTFYGVETPASAGGTNLGILLPTGTGALRIISNVFCGFILAISVSGGENQPGVYLDYNTFYNNSASGTGTGTGIVNGPRDQTVNPSFTSMSTVTGTTGAFVAGNGKLVDTSKNFTALGVVGGRDCVYIFFGTGSTVGMYGISSISTTTNANDTLNLDINPGTDTTANKQYSINIGHNLLPTGAI